MTRKAQLSSQHSVSSPDGALIAILQQSSLVISSHTGAPIRTISLPQDFVARSRFIRWFRRGDKSRGGSQEQGNEKVGGPCSRILLADDDTVRVYDVNDTKWSALIERAASNFGRIADVAFGHSPNEFLVFSDFGVKLTIWSLITCRGIEIRDPKYMVHCYSYRPRTGHMAVLIRLAAQDNLMLLGPGNHGLITSVELPTVDAQEVSWSPDGCWLAIRDAASSGHKVLIYTADGHLFKTYNGAGYAEDIGLGVKRLAWSPSNGILALGDYNKNVTILSKNTFSPAATFHHPSTILLPEMNIWQEQLNVSKSRSYAVTPQPASPPTSAALGKTNSPGHGVSIMSFNGDGILLATKDDSVPTTVWIWSLQSGRPVANLIHHSPVKQVAWHSSQSDLLLIHCAIPEPAVHLWKSSWDAPRIVTLPLERAGSRLEASWLQSPHSDSFNLMITSTHQYATARISKNGDLIPEVGNLDLGSRSVGTGAEDMFDEGNSLDLSPIKIAHDDTMEVHDSYDDGNDSSGSSFEMGNEMVDDTFHYRRHIKAAGGRRRRTRNGDLAL